MGRALVAAALFALAEAVVPGRFPGAWSLDAGAGLPAPVRIAALAATIAAAYGAVRAAAILDPWRDGERRVLAALALAAAIVLAGVAFPSATPLLGDGQLRLNDLAQAAGRGVAEMPAGDDTAPLAFALIGRAHAAIGGHPATAYRVVGAAAGILYAVLALAAAGRLASTPRARAVLLVGLLSTGALPQFLGYVEVYALLLPGGLAFLLAAIADREAGRLPWRAAGVLAVLGALHFSSLALLPVLVLAAKRRIGGIAAGGAAVAGAAAIVGALGYPLVGAGELGPKMLPLLDGSGHRHAYGALSPAHLLDVLQEIVLVAPVAVIVATASLAGAIARAVRGRSRAEGEAPGGSPGDPAGRVLLAAAVSQGGFLLLANPEIGAFRDWDLLAAATLPWTVLACRRLARWEADEAPDAAGEAPGPALPVLAVALAHTLLWVSLNASAARSDARFERQLAHGSVSPRGAGYGWETLARWRLDQGRTADAARAMVRATEVTPDNGRLQLNAGNLLQATGDLEGARRAFTRAVELRPDFAPGRFQRAQLLRALGEEEAARREAEAALALQPRGPLAEEVRRWLGSE